MIPKDARTRVLRLALFLSVGLGYLEWGSNQHGMVFEMEYQLLHKALIEGAWRGILHPFTVVPFVGQLLILASSLWLKLPRLALRSGVVMAALIMGMVLLIGLLSRSFAILGSAIPFFVLAVVVWRRKESV